MGARRNRAPSCTTSISNLVSYEVVRILKPGGRAIFQEPVRNSAMIRS
jgi:hypothetical protein